MTKSPTTKHFSHLSKFYGILSILLTAGPVITYVIMGFCQAEVKQKLTLGITTVIAVLLLVVNIIFKYHIRSVLWILVLGIYFCLKDILPLLLCVAIGTILDEFVVTPLHKSYKEKSKINKEIDRRTL